MSTREASVQATVAPKRQGTQPPHPGVATVAVEAAQWPAYRHHPPTSVAAVDDDGNLIAFSAHEFAMLASRDLAMGKACPALSARSDTDLGDSVVPGGPVCVHVSALPSRPLVTFAGGCRLRDAAISRITVEAFAKLTRLSGDPQ